MSVVADTEGHQASQAIPSLSDMFLGFFLMGMCGFGEMGGHRGVGKAQAPAHEGIGIEGRQMPLRSLHI